MAQIARAKKAAEKKVAYQKKQENCRLDSSCTDCSYDSMAFLRMEYHVK